MCSSSDLVDLNRLRKFARIPHFVQADLNTGDGAITCRLSGELSVEINEGFKVEGKSSLLTFDEDNVATCTFDQKLASPSEADLAVMTTGLAIPFAKVTLLNGIKINLSCPVPR